MAEPAELSDLAHRTFWGQPVTVAHGSLKANLHLPPAASRRLPAVLMLHGLGGDRHEHDGLFIKAAAHFALAGMAALRIDFRGSGETGGDTTSLTLHTQIEDACNAFDYLSTHDQIDPERIAVLGFSFGGMTAACATRLHEKIAGLALWATPFDMKAAMRRAYGPVSLKAVRSRGYMNAGMITLSARFFDAIEETNVTQCVQNLDKPVLLVQAVEDRIVPVDSAYEWRRAMVATDPEILLLSDADHAFTKEEWRWSAISGTVQWLRKQLLKA